MFQALNHFLVLVTLLSIAITGLAVPTRRNGASGTRTVTLSTEFTQLCADAGAGTEGSPVQFQPCDAGSDSQRWTVLTTNPTTIVSVSSSLCAAAGGDTSVILESCQSSSFAAVENWVITEESPFPGSLTGNIINSAINLCMQLSSSNGAEVAGCNSNQPAQEILALDAV